MEDCSLTSVFGSCISEGLGKTCSWTKQNPATLSSRKTPLSTARMTQGKPARRSQQAEEWKNPSWYPPQPTLCQHFPGAPAAGWDAQGGEAAQAQGR